MMFTLRGPDGAALAAEVHGDCPENWLVWFSDLDFSLLSYQLEAAYFGLLPVREEQIAEALSSCEHFTWQRVPVCRGHLATKNKDLLKALKGIGKRGLHTLLGRLAKFLQTKSCLCVCKAGQKRQNTR